MHPKKLLAIAILSLSNPAFGLEIAKDKWVEFMSTAVPTTFCTSSQYFRQCFDVTAQQCEEVATSATRICLKKHEDQIPNSLIQPEDGTYWGNIIGTCAGEAYGASLIDVYIDSDKCRDPSHWQ